MPSVLTTITRGVVPHSDDGHALPTVSLPADIAVAVLALAVDRLLAIAETRSAAVGQGAPAPAS